MNIEQISIAFSLYSGIIPGKGGEYLLKTINLIALVLVIIGAINWGLVGLFSFDLVTTLFGAMTVLSRVVYTLVGIAGVYIAVTSPKLLK